jgi:hypothetical protein
VCEAQKAKAPQNVWREGQRSEGWGATIVGRRVHQGSKLPPVASKCRDGQKEEQKWRMCTNLTELNKCCPKDDFPLARIDKIMDSAAGCEIMALLDYHQIWLYREDEEKTSFITPFGTYCYLSMPQGLRNVGPTFCSMTKASLKDQVDRNMMSYDDDIVMASKQKASYISDLAETFANMCEAKLKLNPEKCVFGVTRGKVLSCLVLTKGIEANPDKIQAILQMQPS